MIVTLTGENLFALRKRLNELINQFVSTHKDLAVERFDAQETESKVILEALKSPPFLSAHKMVVIRDGNTNHAFAEQIEQSISSIPSSVSVVFYEPQMDKRTVYYKTLKNRTRFEQFNLLGKHKLPKWLIAEAKNLGAKLNMSDAIYLVERLGENQEMLYNELSKLAIYNSVISKENIDLLTEPTAQSKVFDLLDAAFAGNKSKALEFYDDQRAQKVEPERILAMIVWQLQLIAFVKSAPNLSVAQIAKDISVNPYPLKKATLLAKKMDQEKIRQMVNEILKIDIKHKTTALDLDEALKTYIATI
jgi:DNA polymerase III delta subunit